MGDTCRVIVLGSTGSIGTQTLEVMEHLNGLHARGESAVWYDVVGLAAGKNETLLGEQATKFQVQHTALAAFESAEVSYFRETCSGTGVDRSHGQGDEAI